MLNQDSVLIWGPALGCLIVGGAIFLGSFVSGIMTGIYFKKKNDDQISKLEK